MVHYELALCGMLPVCLNFANRQCGADGIGIDGYETTLP